MATTTRSTLAYRAAEYFGMQREPRTSVNVGHDKVLLIVQDAKAGFVFFYTEAHGLRDGFHFRLTETRTEKIIDALEGFL